ncbi:MAG: GGDEF domain-containing protein [Treponema sp.]|nr:GGDEF domain-containing protein [Treponema sp.]
MNLVDFLLFRGEKELIANNREPVKVYLNSILFAAAAIFVILVGGMTFVSFKLNYNDSYKQAYSFFFVVGALYLIVYRVFRKFVKKHPLPFVYAFFFIFFCFTIRANFSSVNPQEYVSAVCAMFMIPLLILDRSFRINAFVTLLLLSSLFISYKFKGPGFVERDAVNIIVYYVAGIVLGKSVRINRLKGFDAERVLTIERNTDSLTKLDNRRKLFEYLRRGNESVLMRPTGMFMIDIDKFKQYNDHYGHRAGDICLGIIGNCFAEFGKKNNMKFFRYGGEEFCALCWTKDYLELAACAEDLLQAIRDLRILFNVDGTSSGVVTISLGFSYFDRNENDYNFETMIKVSDAALYSAKSHGRNCARGA